MACSDRLTFYRLVFYRLIFYILQLSCMATCGNVRAP